MSGRAFFDTNVLVYMFDGDAPEKRERARGLFEDSVSRGVAVLSTQVLEEFYVTVTRKLGAPLSEEEAESVVRDLSVLPVTHIDPPLVLQAIRSARGRRISLWDALILEAAIAGGAGTLYTEDLQDGLRVDGLTVRNPFQGSEPGGPTL